MIPFLTAAWAARNWISFGAGAVAAGLLIGVPAYFMVSGARAGERAAIIERDSARGDVAVAQADTTRWQDAAGIYSDAIAKMSEEAERNRADLAQAEAILRTTDELNRIAMEDLAADLAQWKARANANPQDTRPVGPIARDAYCHVVRQATGQVPAGCPATD